MLKPVIGISSCLLGTRVRYDGGDKLQRPLVAWFKDHAELVAFCPEVAIGMGTPRPPIQLSGSLELPEARQVSNPEKNFTLPLKEFANQVTNEISLDGYIFKSRSPSCGLGSTPVVVNGVLLSSTVSGVYAASLVGALPNLPVTEAESLRSEDDFHDFLQLCSTQRRLRQALQNAIPGCT